MTDPAPRPTPADRRAKARQTGQVIIMFALFLTGMFGVLGLAVDLGFAFAGRRTVQNAADGAALAGARAVAKWSTTNPTSAQGEASAIALDAKNVLGSSSQTLVSCEYVDYSNNSVGSCAGQVPAAAKGVRVVVEEEHDTFFIRVVPGAPDNVTTRATATAVVQLADPIKDGPFIVCGDAAWAVRNKTSALNPQMNVPLLTADNKIDPQYVGWTFRVWDNKLSQNNPPPAEAAGCKTPASDWNGSAGDEGAANRNLPVPGDFYYDHGTGAGQVNSTIFGAQGCTAGTDKPYKCVMILPLAKHNPLPTNNTIRVVGFAAFYVESIDPNSVNGRLLSDYIITGRGSDTWCRDCDGLVVIRLRA